MIRKLTLASVVVDVREEDDVQDGQLFCAVAIFTHRRMDDATGVPVIVTGLASDVVASACAAWNALRRTSRYTAPYCYCSTIAAPTDPRKPGLVRSSTRASPRARRFSLHGFRRKRAF